MTGYILRDRRGMTRADKYSIPSHGKYAFSEFAGSGNTKWLWAHDAAILYIEGSGQLSRNRKKEI